ncbi:MAG TPA: alpha/beta hydrolase [Gemmatimonadales bacterium]|jgi:pimeloyl-ACP methyl ester carboxylesterase|nr:alpha/beta hydrolase [Gemmatimonadales bacterium]
MIGFDPRVRRSATSFAGPLVMLALAGCGDKPAAKGAEAPLPAQPVSQIQGPAGSIHIDDGGSGGIPVVFLHSFAGSTAHWSAQLAHLRTSRRAVAVDFRGHGQSAPPANGDYAVESLAQDVAAVVDSLGLTRFILVGHSMGGSAAVAYAAAHPDRVAGLVLVGAPGKVPEAQAKQIMASLDSNYDKVMAAYSEKLLAGAQPAVRTRLVGEMGGVPKEKSLTIIHALFAFDPLPGLKSYTGPKLIVSTDSGNDPNDLQNAMPEVPHKAITGTSHWPQLDKPDEFNGLLDEFLATIH